MSDWWERAPVTLGRWMDCSEVWFGGVFWRRGMPWRLWRIGLLLSSVSKFLTWTFETQ